MARPKEFDCEVALDRALGVFWSKGYEATSIQDLVAATGVQRQSLYDTFGDKHELYLAALRRYAKQTSLEVGSRSRPAATPLELLRDFVVATLDDATGQCRGCMAVNAAVELGPSDDQVTELIRGSLAELERALVTLVEDARRLGQVAASVDPVHAARSLIVMSWGFRAIGRVQNDRPWLESVVDSVLSRLLPPR